MRTEVTTRALWKPGDIVIYKSHGRSITAVVLGRYDDVPETNEPRYVIGLLALPQAQHSETLNRYISDSLRSLVKASSEGVITNIRPLVRRVHADWSYQSVYDQESAEGNYRLATGFWKFYRRLSKGYPLLSLDNAHSDYIDNSFGKPLVYYIGRVSQHLLHHPLERTKPYKTDKKSLEDNRN